MRNMPYKIASILWKRLQTGNKKELDYAAWFFKTSVPKLLNKVQKKVTGVPGKWTYPKYRYVVKSNARAQKQGRPTAEWIEGDF